ncbi:MAG TPA: hypothetical protein VF032_02780 [Thermoleophilaceae bacterium]
MSDTSRPPVARAAKRLYRGIVGPYVEDQARAWPGTASDGLETIRHFHIGDCNFRRMEYAHDPTAPAGYPLAAAEELLPHGIGVEFSHYFAINFENLPTREELVRRYRLGGPPDVVTVQIGGNYTRWIVIPDTKRTMQLRMELGRRIGRHNFAAYRLLHPFTRIFGRAATPYFGSAAFEGFIRMLQDMWPEAHLVVVSPFPRCHEYPSQRPIARRVDSDVRMVAERCGATLLDGSAILGRDPSLRGATGYNINSRGAELVGRALADKVLALNASGARLRDQAAAGAALSA